jgi:hypothetical protein
MAARPSLASREGQLLGASGRWKRKGNGFSTGSTGPKPELPAEKEVGRLCEDLKRVYCCLRKWIVDGAVRATAGTISRNSHRARLAQAFRSPRADGRCSIPHAEPESRLPEAVVPGIPDRPMRSSESDFDSDGHLTTDADVLGSCQGKASKATGVAPPSIRHRRQNDEHVVAREGELRSRARDVALQRRPPMKGQLFESGSWALIVLFWSPLWLGLVCLALTGIFRLFGWPWFDQTLGLA